MKMQLFGDQTTGTARAKAAAIACKHCGGTESRVAWQTFSDGTRHIRQECAACGAFIKWLPQHRHQQPEQHPGEPAGYYHEPRPADAHQAELAPPAAESVWLGHVRQDNGVWRPVSLTATLAGCWDALLTYPGRGDCLCCPAEDTRGDGAAEAPAGWVGWWRPDRRGPWEKIAEGPDHETAWAATLDAREKKPGGEVMVKPLGEVPKR